MLAVASTPDQSLLLSNPSTYLAAGHFDLGGPSDLVSVTRTGRIDVAVNNNQNAWGTRSTYQATGVTSANPVLGATTALLNNDPFDDLVLQTASGVVMLVSDGHAGWQSYITTSYTGVVDVASHPSVKPIAANIGNDTHIDLVLPIPQTNQIAILYGTSDGKFQAPVYLATGSPSSSRPVVVASGNVLGGPSNDVVVGFDDGSVRFFEGNNQGALQLRSDLTLTSLVGSISALQAYDFDRDGLSEIVVTGKSGAALLKSLPDPLAASPIANGDFSQGLTGWRTQYVGQSNNQDAGIINAKSTVAQFSENQSFLTSLSQSFVIPANPQSIDFDLIALGLGDDSPGQLPDAFEVSLLDNASTSLVPTHQPSSTAFVNFAPGGNRSVASGVTIQGSKVKLDISRLTPGSTANLVFDLIGNPNASASTATIDNVHIAPDIVRNDAFSVTKLAGTFGSPSDVAVGDVDGDNLTDIVVSDLGQSTIIVYNGIGGVSFARSIINVASTGGPTEIALGTFTAPDTILDIAAAFSGKSLALTPLLADTTLPTATLVSPQPTVTLGTSENASAALGSVILQFSEAMQFSSANSPGSANNPRAYRFYNVGPDGVDNRGSGDDILFPITSVNYNSTSNLATLTIDPASLVDPTRAAASLYKVLVIGANQTIGLRDLAGNLLEGGQDVSAQINVIRQFRLDLPQALVAQEGSLVSFNAALAHYTFAPNYTATIQWGDGSSSKVVGDDAFPIEQFLTSHVYANNGSFTVTVKVSDVNNQTIATQSTTVQVQNVAPVLGTLPAISANEGANVGFQFIATDPSSQDNLTALIAWGDGTTSTISPAKASGQFQFSTSHTFPDNGIFNVQVTVSDGTDTTTSKTNALIANVAPNFVTANTTATVGQALNISSIIISDPGFNSIGASVETFTASIDWGDGTGIQPSVITDYVAGNAGKPTTAKLALSHTYTTAGQFTVRLTVSDDDGGAEAKSFMVTVQQNSSGSACLPVIDFDTDAFGNAIVASSQLTDMWSSWGVHVASNDPAKHPLAVLNSASTGATDNVLIIADTPSTATPTSYTGGGTINFYFDATVRIDQLRLLKIPRGQFATVRWYDRAATKIGEVKITGDDSKLYQTVSSNAIGVRRLEVQFTGSGAISDITFCNDQVPGGTIQTTGASTTREGDKFVLNLSGLANADGWTINWGDGSVSSLSGPSSRTEHVFADGPGKAMVRAFARQGANVFAAKPLTAAIENVIPKLTINGNASVSASELYTLALSKSDPGVDTIQGWLIDWGDGSKPQLIAGNPSSATHTFSRQGTYSVRAHAFDEDYDGPRYSPSVGSLVQIQARGDEGGERFDLLIDDQLVQSFVTTTEFQMFRYASTKPVAPNQIKVRFTNDMYDPTRGIDNNLIVDFMTIDGKVYQTEASDVYSTGTWQSSDGVKPGFRKSEWLHANGYFQYDYDANDGTRLIIRARGDQGDETFDLLINGRVVKRFTATTTFNDYEYRSSRIVTLDQVRIAFTNDLYDKAKKIDRNLTVDYIRLNETVYQTEDRSVFSNGVWLAADGIRPGYGRGQTLNANGYFQFAEVPTPSPFDTAWVSNSISVFVKPEQSIALPTIDFERAADSSPLKAGDKIVNQFSSLGITISTASDNTIATIIDSASPLKNVLAISRKDDHEHDDDDEHDDGSLKLTSGTLVFTFKSAVQMDEVHLYDVSTSGSSVRLFRADGTLISDTAAINLGAKSFQKIVLNATGVRRMEISLASPASVAAIVSSRLASPIAAPATKFYVVDSNDLTYRYTSSGSSIGQFSISSTLNARDIATTGKGNPLWILSDEGSNKRIYVTNSEQEKLLGTWIASGLTKPEGIATDGRSIWIVDDATNVVQRYDEAAIRRSGSQAKSSQFALDSQNQNPKGITTDGEFLWVVDSTSDKVFIYDLAGKLLNSWRLDPENADPSGLTINAEGNKMWVVDAVDDRVYVYSLNSLGPSTSTKAVSSFALASTNTNPQGIADPGGLYTIGQVRTSNIATAGAIDDYSFSGIAGQKIYVNFQLLSEGGLQSSLFAPDGNLIYSRDDSRVFIHNSGVITLTQSGSYTLRLTSSATPAYQFQIFDVPPPEVKPVVFGQPNSGGIETPGAQDQWTFTGRGGTDVYLDVLSLDTVFGGDVIFAIVAPDGSTVSEKSSTVEFRVDQSVTLPVDGQYRIVVKADFNGAQLPTYSFRLWEVPPPDVQSIAFRQTATGAIEVPGAKDRWTFNATAGQNIFLDFLTVANGELQALLAAPDGTLLYDNYSGLESTLDREFVLPQTGTYTVTTRAALGSPSLNTYSFQIWDIPPQIVQPAVLNENITGSIVPGESKIFDIVAQANTPILLDIIDSSSGTIGVTLIGPDGATLADSVIKDSLLTLAQKGTYRAIVQTSSTDPSALDAYGTFAFRLQDASSPAIGGTDSLGTRFYIGFPRNLLGLLGPSSPDYSISITSPTNTSGTIQIPGINKFYSYDVLAGQTTTIALPSEVEIFTPDQTLNKGILVTAIDEVALYGLNQLTASTDGYTALPVDAIGRSYVVMGYGNTVHLGGGGGTNLTIVGTADNTTATITPTVTAGSHPAGIPFTVTLNAGQAYTLHVDTQPNNITGTVDLTGTLVNSDKPISVYGGNTAAFVPAGFEAADHLIEQLPPIESWGKHFVTEPLATRTRGDTFRVLAQSDNTEVRVNGALVTTLANGKFYEAILTVASTIDTSQPALVAQYANGQSFDNVPSDPFMMLVPPTEQFQSDYTLTTPVTNFDINYANLVVPIAGIPSVRRDGQSIPTSAFTAIGSSGFAGAQIPIGVGSHHFTSDVPFGVSIYGFRQVESYGYFGGMSLAPLNRVASLSLAPSNLAVPINTQQTMTANVVDLQGNPLRGVRVEFAVTGTNPTHGFSFTDATGRASFQFTGKLAGPDNVSATAAGKTQVASIVWSASLPTIAIQSPVSLENLPIGKRVLVGSAKPTVPGSVIAEVLVDGVRVEAIDATGNFIAPISIISGSQTFNVIAIDSLGQQSSTSITVTGVVDDLGGFSITQGVDKTSTTQVQFAGTTFNRSTNRLSVDVRVKNLNLDVIDSNTAVRFDAIDPTRVGLLNADQRTAEGLPLVLFNSKIPTNGLGKDQSSSPSSLTFDNPVRDRFTPQVTVLTRANRAPQFTSAPPVEATVGRVYRYAVTAVDPDGSSPLTYQLTTAPSGMAIDSARGLITWTPLATDAATHTVSVKVQDASGGEAVQTFALNVALTRVNRPPVFTTAPVISAVPLSNYQYAASARDIDGDAILYALSQSPTGMTIDSVTGVVKLSSIRAGTYPISITASDSRGGVATQDFTLFVGTDPTRTAPLITSTPPVVAYLGLTYVYSVAVTDANKASLQFQLQQAPAGMSISPTGRITWLPQATQTGPQAVRLSVTNSSGGSASQSFTVEAIAQRPNLGPQFSSIPLRIASIDQDYRYTVVATDPEQSILAYALTFAPAGMSINSLTGAIAWKPTATQVGSQRVQVSASDAQGLIATQTFAIDVRRTNTPPTFSSTPINSIMVGDAYRYNALATDLEDSVTYSVISGPTAGVNGMQIDPRSGAITWQPRAADIGNYGVTVRATDDRGSFADQAFDLSVVPDRRAPTVSIRLERTTINVGESVRIDVRAYDASGVDLVSLSINGLTVALDPSGGYVYTATASGIPNIVATAIDRAGNTATVSADPALHVLDASDTEPPLIQLTAPASGSTVTYLTDIVGTITDRNLEYFELQYALANTDQWTTFARRQFRPIPVGSSGSNGITNGTQGVFDPTMLANDTYQIRAIAQDTNGAQSTAIIELSVESQAKIGNYAVSFTDLAIPLAGLPITIGRTYDTLNAQSIGDFGYGWRLDIGNPRIRESVRISESELAGAGPLAANPFRTGTRVYMNTPDGRRVGFTFTPEVTAGLLGAIWTPKFTADPGVDYRLEVPYASLSQRSDGTFGLYLIELPYNPDTYTLISKDQVRYTYSQFSDMQLKTVQDRNNVTLTFDSFGIHSSIGQEILWTRDSQGRIAQITDPAGRVLKYEYNSAGDLVAMRNTVGDTANISYFSNPAHYVRTFTDARGITVQEVTYDENRLSGIRDAAGASTLQSYDLANQTEVFADRLGNESIVKFDVEGNITEVTDALGNTVSTIYNSQNLPIQVKDARGNVTRMDYDDRRNLTKLTDALGNVSTISYNLQNEIVSKTDELGHKVVYEYDTKGNRTAIVDQLGFRTTMVPDDQGRTKSFTTPNGKTWQYVYSKFDAPDRTVHPDGTFRDSAYNANGELTGITDENGKSVIFQRDSAGRQTSSNDPLGYKVQIAYEQGLARQMTDQLGRVTRFEYDAQGRVIREIDPLGNTVTTDYDANDRIVARIDENGNKSGWEYDKNNRVVKKINALGFATRMTYDPNGNVLQDIDSSGATTKYEYDSLDRLISTTLPDGTVTRTNYDAVGRITSTIGPRGETTRYEYDNANQLIRVTDPMLGTYQQSFDGTGNLVSITDPRGNITSRSYDNRNRLTQITDAAGYITKYDLDNIGRVIKVTDQEGSKTSFQYDARGKVVSMTAADGGVGLYEYDAVGNRVKAEDPLGRVSVTTYDALDRPVKTVDPKGAVTLVRYDAVGNVTRLTDASGNATQWSYDALNRVSKSIDPLGGTEQFIYDNVALACGCVLANGRGHLSEYIDKLGRHTVYKYDSRNRNTEVIYRDANEIEVDRIQLSYDTSSNLTSISDNDSQLKFTFDLNNRPLTSDNSGTPGVRPVTLTNTWDSSGNRIRVSDGDGVSVTSTYDSRNLLKTLTWSGPTTGNAGIAPAHVDFNYNGRGQTTQELRSSNATGSQVVSKTVRTYDSVGRADKITHQSAIDSVMAQFDTDWNVANELVAWTIDGNKSTYEYDLTGQLTKADHVTAGLADEAFSYDATGNRTGVSKTVGPNNRLSSDEKFDYGYDAEGNTVSKLERSTGNEQRFTYDHLDRMLHTETRSSAGILLSSVDYRYDALGRRIARTVDSDGNGPSAPTIQTFVYDGSDVWLDADGSGATTARYLHGTNADETIARYRPSEGTAWYLPDHLGSVREIVDASGTIIDRITYDSFGSIVSESAPAAGDRFKFTGREWDAEAGLYYYRSRMYDPFSGRFLSEDQIGFAAGDVNLHRYVGNMPGSYSDPSGNIAMADYGGALGFSRIAVALASGLAGFTFGYTCGYLDALTIQGLKGPEAEFYAKREGLLVGSIDFAASMTLDLKGTVGSKIFGVALFASGSLGLTVASQLVIGEEAGSGPAIIAKNICTAISVVGGYNVGRTANKLTSSCSESSGNLAKRTISPGAYLRHKYAHLTPQQRMARIDDLSRANYQRRLDEAIAGQKYVYRYLTADGLAASFKYNSVRGYATTEFSYSGAAVASGAQVLADWGNPALGPSKAVKYGVAIPVSELTGYRVTRPFGGKGTIGWEFRTNSYPTAGPGGWIQFDVCSVPLDKVYIFTLK